VAGVDPSGDLWVSGVDCDGKVSSWKGIGGPGTAAPPRFVYPTLSMGSCPDIVAGPGQVEPPSLIVWPAGRLQVFARTATGDVIEKQERVNWPGRWTPVPGFEPTGPLAAGLDRWKRPFVIGTSRDCPNYRVFADRGADGDRLPDRGAQDNQDAVGNPVVVYWHASRGGRSVPLWVELTRGIPFSFPPAEPPPYTPSAATDWFDLNAQRADVGDSRCSMPYEGTCGITYDIYVDYGQFGGRPPDDAPVLTKR
jgi:hypothetical protein